MRKRREYNNEDVDKDKDKETDEEEYANDFHMNLVTGWQPACSSPVTMST